MAKKKTNKTEQSKAAINTESVKETKENKVESKAPEVQDNKEKNKTKKARKSNNNFFATLDRFFTFK